MYINSAYKTHGLQLLPYDDCRHITINFNDYTNNLKCYVKFLLIITILFVYLTYLMLCEHMCTENCYS
jgi:hypothetical protein